MCKQRKKIKMFFLTFLIYTIFLSGLTVNHAFAANEEYEKYMKEPAVTADNYKQNGQYPTNVDAACETTPYDFFKYIVANGVVDDMKSALTGSDFINSINDQIKTTYDTVALAGEALLVVMFLMDLLDKATRNGFDFEQVVRLLIKFFIAKTLMDNGYNILKAIVAIGNALADSVSAAPAPKGIIDFLNKLGYVLSDSGTLTDWVITFLAFFPYVIARILNLVIYATCYGRIIDIMVRGGWAPIGCISMVQEGFSGRGLVYIKKFFASCIQGAVIIGILNAGSMVCSNLVGGALNGIGTDGSSVIGPMIGAGFTCLIVIFTEVMLILKSQGLANDIAGV